MPRKLKEGEWPKNQGRSEKYPYDLWFDGMPCVLLRGRDYTSSDASLKVSIHNGAKKRGIQVETARVDDGMALRPKSGLKS